MVVFNQARKAKQLLQEFAAEDSNKVQCLKFGLVSKLSYLLTPQRRSYSSLLTVQAMIVTTGDIGWTI